MVWELLYGIFYISLGLILFYYCYFFLRLVFHKNDTAVKTNLSVSVVICARNEADNLKDNLPSIVEQVYPNFELLLIDDGSTDESGIIMQHFAQQYAFVHYHRLDIDKTKYPGKKYALQFGVEQAKHEIILVTDADCKAVSKLWIQKMIAPFTEQVDLVLGFGPYYKRKGWFNALARYECIYTAVKYLSFAKANLPYMGVGRNMAYRKKVFMDNGGFESHIHIPSGDDDLFVREIAKKDNVRLQMHPDSLMWSSAAPNWKAFVRQKHRHLSVGFYYKPLLKLFLGLDLLSIYTFHGLILLFFSYNKLTPFIICLIISKTLLQMLIFGKIYHQFRLNFSFLITPLVDFLHIISYFYISIKVLINKTIEWR